MGRATPTHSTWLELTTTIAGPTRGCKGPSLSASQTEKYDSIPFGANKMIPGRRPLSIVTVVPILGLSYFAFFAVGLILRSLISGASLASYQVFFIPLASLAALCAVTVWWKPRAGYMAAAALSIVLIAIFFLTQDGNDVITVLSNPARNYLQFAFYLTAVPQFFSTLGFSLLGLWRIRSTLNKENQTFRTADMTKALSYEVVEVPSGSIKAMTIPKPQYASSLKGLLEDKVAIVTGSSRGIGAASARVFLHYRHGSPHRWRPVSREFWKGDRKRSVNLDT